MGFVIRPQGGLGHSVPWKARFLLGGRDPAFTAVPSPNYYLIFSAD